MSAQLWISDVEKVILSQDANFRTLSVVGTVVSIERTSNPEDGNDRRPTVFHLDDGTGVIRVVHFPQATKSIREGLFPDKDKFMCSDIQIGSTLEVKGVSQEFNMAVEIKAYRIRKVLDANDEIDRMFQVDRLKRAGIYSSLFQRPSST